MRAEINKVIKNTEIFNKTKTLFLKILTLITNTNNLCIILIRLIKKKEKTNNIRIKNGK